VLSTSLATMRARNDPFRRPGMVKSYVPFFRDSEA